MPYDWTGEAYQQDDDPRWGWIAALLIALAIFLSLLGACTATTRSETHDSLDATLTADGSYIYWYVMVDPDTGIEYLVNDRGGSTPRLDSAGRPIRLSSFSG